MPWTRGTMLGWVTTSVGSGDDGPEG
jgi:hypothetical protein